jgi:predicted HD phosphohydrolase
MDQGTAQEYHFLGELYKQLDHGIADTLLNLLRSMAGPKLGYQIDRYQHSLQSAARAEHDGADEETIVCALLHDIGDVLAPHNHSAVAAEILRPYVSEQNYWVIRHHGLFQGYYYFHHVGGDRNARDRYRDHPYYQACVDFCERWDQRSFDPDYPTPELEHFEPMVRRVFERSPHNYD